MTIEWALSIIAGLFGSLNIFQLIFWRSARKKHSAEAASAEADAKQKHIDIQQQQFNFLQTKLHDFETKYYDVVEKLQVTLHEKIELTQHISQLEAKIELQNKHISELKAEIETLSKRFKQDRQPRRCKEKHETVS